MPIRDLCLALFVCLIWGLNFIAVKFALEAVPPFLLTTLRFLIASICLVPFFRITKAQVLPLIGIAVTLGVGHFGLLYLGISGMDAATAAIVTQLGVPFSVLLSIMFFGDSVDLPRIVGLVTAFIGVGLLAGEPHVTQLWPILVGAASMLLWAISTMQIKKIAPINSLALNGWTALFATPMLLGVSLTFEANHWDGLNQLWQSPTALGGVLYTAFGSTLLAYTLWYRLLERHAVSKVVPILMLSPVIGVSAGVLILGEILTWQKLLGGALTIGGVAVVQLMGKRNGQAKS